MTADVSAGLAKPSTTLPVGRPARISITTSYMPTAKPMLRFAGRAR